MFFDSKDLHLHVGGGALRFDARRMSLASTGGEGGLKGMQVGLHECEKKQPQGCLEMEAEAQILAEGRFEKDVAGRLEIETER